MKRLWSEVTAVGRGYGEERVPRMAAALSYYTVFSLAPLLVIAISIAGLVFGDDPARGHITTQFRTLVGEEGGRAVETMVENAHKPAASILATAIGAATLLIGAMGVFGELQDSLNTIWQVRTKPGRTFRGFLRARLLSFAMVFGTGFLLLVSLLVSAAVAALGGIFHLPTLGIAAAIGDNLVSFVVIGLLFAMTFKLLPDVRIRWRDVWIGAAVTTTLFLLGKFLIGLYLGRSAIASAYGSMGSLAVLLIWVYYSSQVFLIGALFTRAHAVASGSHVEPLADAEWIPGREPKVAPPEPERMTLQEKLAM